MSLEEEFPEEFRYTALLASALFVVILSLYAATMHPSVSGARLGSHGAAAPPPRAPHPAPRAPRPCATHRVALRIVREALASGELRPGGEITEGTAGSTGVSVALVAAALGCKARRPARRCSIHWFPYDRVRVVNAVP